MKLYVDYLIRWLDQELKYRQADCFIFGVSGGVDSAVIAFLLAKAYQKQSLGVIMPCMSNSQDSADALLVMDACQLPCHTVELTKTHEQLMEAVTPEFYRSTDETKNRVIIGNTSARLRMTTLYTIAQAKNGIVVGTDNAVEWHMGYFTKFGDGGVDIAPLIHLNKDEVYELARFLGVPETIINKAPSAGLWAAQTDEDEMGVRYAILNQYLQGEAISKHEQEIIRYWHERSHHKRAMPRIPEKPRPSEGSEYE